MPMAGPSATMVICSFGCVEKGKVAFCRKRRDLWDRRRAGEAFLSPPLPALEASTRAFHPRAGLPRAFESRSGRARRGPSIAPRSLSKSAGSPRLGRLSPRGRGGRAERPRRRLWTGGDSFGRTCSKRTRDRKAAAGGVLRGLCRRRSRARRSAGPAPRPWRRFSAVRCVVPTFVLSWQWISGLSGGGATLQPHFGGGGGGELEKLFSRLNTALLTARAQLALVRRSKQQACALKTNSGDLRLVRWRDAGNGARTRDPQPSPGTSDGGNRPPCARPRSPFRPSDPRPPSARLGPFAGDGVSSGELCRRAAVDRGQRAARAHMAR